MINIPSNLQSAWDDVSKDGKIDKADVKKLVEAAAPGITKATTAEELDKALTNEIDKAESEFLANFSATDKGAVLLVKTGTAPGTFEFITNETQDTPKKGDIPAGTTLKLFEPLKLPDAGQGGNEPVKTEATGNTEANPPVPTNAIAERIKKLNLLKDSLPAVLGEPELSAEITQIEGKIKKLEEKLAAEKPAAKDDKSKEVSGDKEKPKVDETKNKETEKTPEELKKQEEAKKIEDAKQQEENKQKIKENNKANISTTLEGLHDVIGNGFWNAQNKEGIGGMLQLMAKQGLLEETIKKLDTDDQKEAIKILVKGNNSFNHAIASQMYASLSASANIDGDFNKSELFILQTKVSTTAFEVEPAQFYKGMKYSLSHEKEAAMTMARGIINGEVNNSVLTKFSSSDLEAMVKLVDKMGTDEEKETLSKVIAASYIKKGHTVKIDDLPKTTKARILKEVLSTDNISESKIKETVKDMGKKVIFEAVNHIGLTDEQLATLAKNTDGDEMADDPEAATNLLMGMIREYNKDQKGSVSLTDINKFIDEVDHDWWSDDDVMKNLIRKLGDGPDSEYAKFKHLAPATLDKIWKIS